MTVAEVWMLIVEFGAAMFGEAETPPVLAKVTGRNGPTASKKAPNSRDALRRPSLCRKRSQASSGSAEVITYMKGRFIGMNPQSKWLITAPRG